MFVVSDVRLVTAEPECCGVPCGCGRGGTWRTSLQTRSPVLTSEHGPTPSLGSPSGRYALLLALGIGFDEGDALSAQRGAELITSDR